MTRIITAILALAILFGVTAQATELKPILRASDADILDAIQSRKGHVLKCRSIAFWSDAVWEVTFASNLGLISMSAEKRTKRYEKYGLDDVDSIYRVPSLTVFADNLGGTMGAVIDGGKASHIVLRRRKTEQEDLIQPMNVEMEIVPLTNGFGATFERVSAIARFDYKEVLDIASRGDVEVIVVTSRGERKCWVDNKKVAQMFEWVKR